MNLQGKLGRKIDEIEFDSTEIDQLERSAFDQNSLNGTAAVVDIKP